MNSYLKSAALLVATLSAPIASTSQAADEPHHGRHVQKHGHGGQQPATINNTQQPQRIVQQPSQFQSQPVVIQNQGQNHESRQGGPSLAPVVPRTPPVNLNNNHTATNPPTFSGNRFQNPSFGNTKGHKAGVVSPFVPGMNNRTPAVNTPVVNPSVTDNAKSIRTVPGVVGHKPIDLTKKPNGGSRTPIDLSKRPIDPSPKDGKSIDPGFNAKRLPKIEISHDRKPQDRNGVKPPTILPKPGGIVRTPHPMPKLADGHKLHIAEPGKLLADRMKRGDLHRIADSKIGKQIELKKQFELHQHGDLARRLNLGQQLALHGGWQKRLCGPIDPLYGRHCFSSWYCGPSFFPGFCWFPQWSPWVNWCWNFDCLPICDPRPICCRPYYYDPCVAWIGWDYPVWAPMPVVTCGTWVDVPTVVVNAGYDVQLLAVRFVDPGHPEQQLGPRYRVWLRNNSPVAIQQPFNVLTYASNDRSPAMGLPEAGLRIDAMDAGQILSVDLRLPVEANTLARDGEGHKVPFQFLHVIVDSHREVPEAFEQNNGAVLARGDVLPVDPAVFAADSEELASGSVINVAGEGFGPEPGQVLVNIGGMELQAEVVGWYDLGVQIRLPRLALASDVAAELVVVRGDRAASNPLTIDLSAAGNVTQTSSLPSP